MVDYNRKESYLGSDKSTVMVDTLVTDLDVSTFQIHSSANRDLRLNHHGTGNVKISGMKFPNADGSPNYYLKTDGAGNLSWASVSSNAFTDIAVSGQNTIQADQSGDTLTFASGDGINLTTNDGTDTLTVSMIPGSANRYVYVATANQTVFTGSDSNGNTLSFSGTQLDVFMNGIKLNRQTSSSTTDFTVTNGNTVTLQSAAAAGDLIEILAFANYTVSNVLNVSNNLSDVQSASTARTNLGISNFGSTLIDDTDAATARTTLGLGTMAVETASNYLTTSSASSTYAPLSGANFVGNVGIGTNSPTVLLDLESANPIVRLTDSDASGTPECQISGAGGDLILDADRDNEKSSSLISFKVDSSERMKIDSSGVVTVGISSKTTDTDIKLVNDNKTFGIRADRAGSYFSVVDFTAGLNRLIIKSDGVLQLQNSIEENVINVTSTNTSDANHITSSAIQLDVRTSNNFYLSVGGNSPTLSVVGLTSGKANIFTLEVSYGGGTINWGSAIKWNAATAPTQSSSGTDIYVFYSRDGGTTIQGFTAGQALA